MVESLKVINRTRVWTLCGCPPFEFRPEPGQMHFDRGMTGLAVDIAQRRRELILADHFSSAQHQEFEQIPLHGREPHQLAL